MLKMRRLCTINNYEILSNSIRMAIPHSTSLYFKQLWQSIVMDEVVTQSNLEAQCLLIEDPVVVC